MGILAKATAWLRRPLPATHALARLGLIAASLSGLAIAFHVGGRDGYALPLTALLGAPANLIILRIVHFIHPIPIDALWSGADWNLYLLLFCGCIAVNWTLVGVVADFVGSKPPSPRESLSDAGDIAQLTEADFDPLLREFEALERQVREPDRPRDRRRAA